MHRLPALSRNGSTKVVHRPKVFVCDTALRVAVVGKDAAALDRRNEPMTGPLVESFAVAEIAKQLTASCAGWRPEMVSCVRPRWRPSVEF